MADSQGIRAWLGCFLVAAAGLAGSAAPDLVEPGQASLAARQSLDQRVLSADVRRARPVDLASATLDRLRAGETNLRVEFFPDAAFEVSLKPLPSHGGPGKVWKGRSVGGPTGLDFTLAHHDGAILASCIVPGPDGQASIYKLLPGPGNQYASVEMKPEQQKPCGVNPALAERMRRLAAALPAEPQTTREIVPAETFPEVDIAVFWTPATRTAYGGEAGVRVLVDNAVADANVALANSNNVYRYRLVFAGEALGYEKDNAQLTDLQRLANTTDGFLDEVHSIRESVRADLVALITDTFTDSCGIAYLLDNISGGRPTLGFSVTAANCISNRTFAHEIGHNMGCMHARGDGGTGIFPYSYGLRFRGTDNVDYRTVMAYAPGLRINFFSNPSVVFQGVPTGISSSSAQSADNARTQNETYSTVMNYRARKTGSEPANLVAGPNQLSFSTTARTGSLLRAVAVGNSGSGVLTVAAGLSPAIPGVTLSATSVTVTADQAAQIAVQVQPGLAPTGVTNLTLSLNASNGQSRTVPVSITILAPGNDDFARSWQLPAVGGSASASTVDGTIETGELLPPGVTNPRTVWWSWTYAGPDATYRLSTVGSLGDSFVGVYEGSAVNQLTTLVTSRSGYEEAGSLGGLAPFGGAAVLDLSVTSGTTYRIQVGTEAAASQGTTVSLHVYPRPGLAPLGSAPAFTLSGQDAGRMSSLNLGSVLLNDTTGEYQLQVQTSPRTRIFGILESPETDLPYAAVGEGRFVRGKFHVTYSGPGDSASSTLANLVPNFRMGLRTRAAVNAVLEVQHNAGTGDPGNRDLARELGPSRDESKPSRYAVDLDPVDVPSLLNSSTEGIQRSFELVAALPDYTYVSGTLRVTDASIHTYPALSTGADPSKIYQTGGSNGSSDFNNPSVVTAILGFSRDEILRYFTGSSNPDDYFGPGVINFSIGEAGMNVSASALTGISVSSVVLPSSRIGLAAVDFTGGNNEDRTNNASRLRSAAGVRHLVSYRLLTSQNSNTVPYIRFRARSVKFAWSSMLELSGGRALDSTDGQALLAEVLPGVGNAVPAPNSTPDGVWYHMIVPSPLDRRIRQDRQLSDTDPLTTLFPTLAAEPGPGSSAVSRRDLLLGFDVVDTLSFGTQHPAEAANNLRLNRIEVRQFPELEE